MSREAAAARQIDDITSEAMENPSSEASEEVEPTTEDSSCESSDLDNLPPERLAFVVMMCVIGGYTLIGPLQHDLKHHLRIADRGTLSEAFTQSTALVQWGKTAMTLGQNFLLACLSPKARVYLAILGMFVGVLIPPLIIFALGSQWLGWVVISYGTIGFSLGVYECTFLSVISPLGPLTKSWAIMGFPAAFGTVNIVGGSLKALFDLPPAVLFWYVAACMPLGAVVFHRIAPAGPRVGQKSYKQASMLGSLREWQAWAPPLLPFVAVNVVSHFVMESTLPAIFNTYNHRKVALYGPHSTDRLMDTRWFLVVLYAFMLAADMGSRRIGYCVELRSYRASLLALLFSLGCCIGGLLLLTLGVAVVSWFAIALAFFGSGFNYAVASRYIDRAVPRKHNLAAYSLWMFLGYLGAISGAVLVTLVQSWICGGDSSQYQCT